MPSDARSAIAIRSSSTLSLFGHAVCSRGLALVAAIGAVDWVWNLFAGLKFFGWERLLPGIAGVLLLGAFCARGRAAPPLVEMTFYGALWIALTVLGCILTYLAATIARPLADRSLVQIDAALGFDWPAWVRTVAAHPLWRGMLWLAYHGLPLQIIGSIAAFALLRVPRRNDELLLAGALGLVMTAAVAALLPTLGPRMLFGDAIRTDVDPAYIAHVLALRQGGAGSFVLPDLQGIVTFPSYHATLAALFCFAHRDLRQTRGPVAVINALMVLSIPSEGGHYFVDIAAGFAVALAAIAGARLLIPRACAGD
jgi:hypothetical protein